MVPGIRTRVGTGADRDFRRRMDRVDHGLKTPRARWINPGFARVQAFSHAWASSRTRLPLNRGRIDAFAVWSEMFRMHCLSKMED